MTDFTRCLRLLSAAALLVCAFAASGCANQGSDSTAAAAEQKMYTPPHPVPFPGGMTGTHATQP
jgi:hypothetical protein